METIDLADQIETILNSADASISGSTHADSAAICKTMIACTRALCMEISALRQVVDSIDTDLSSIDFKIPDQS